MKALSLRFVVPALVLSVSFPVLAVEGVRWDKASLSYVTADADDESLDLNGFALFGSKLLNENVFVQGRIETIGDNVVVEGISADLDISRFSLGAGYRHGVSPVADVFGVVSYESMESTISSSIEDITVSVSETTNGLSFEFGVRGFVNEQFEMGASIKQWRFDVADGEDGSDSGLHLFADYHFDERYAIGLARSSMEDITFTELKGTMLF